MKEIAASILSLVISHSDYGSSRTDEATHYFRIVLVLVK